MVMPQGGFPGQPGYPVAGRSRGSFPPAGFGRGPQPVPFPTQPGLPQASRPVAFPRSPVATRPVRQPTFAPQPRWQAAPQQQRIRNPYHAQGQQPRPQGNSYAYGNVPPPPSETQRQAPKRIFRGQSPEERESEQEAPPPPNRISLSLPPPSAMGIEPKTSQDHVEPGRVDWNVAWAKYKRLGATGFRLDQLESGRYRIQFALTSGSSGRSHLVEGSGATEAAAMTQALERAERAETYQR
ncbi:MAG: hypothetical protein ACFCD0_04705 [Gemmataceae bacterium]